MATEKTVCTKEQVDQYNNIIQCNHGYRVHLTPSSCIRGHGWYRSSGYMLCSKCGASFYRSYE